jgi:hypothetical protein
MARPSTALLNNPGSYFALLAALIAGGCLLGSAGAQEGQTNPNPAQNFLIEHEVSHRSERSASAEDRPDRHQQVAGRSL